MLINLSNHPYKYWLEGQIMIAKREFGEVIDLPFPDINPEAKPAGIKAAAEKYTEKIIRLSEKYNDTNKPFAVHLMGEMTFSFALVSMLLKKDIRCVASTTERITEQKDTRKISEFRFVRFRDYKLL